MSSSYNTSLASDKKASPNQDYLAVGNKRIDDLRVSDPNWLHQLRRAALYEFRQRGFPQTKMEAWKYTRLDYLTQHTYRLHENKQEDDSEISRNLRLPLPELTHQRVVLVNGYMDKQLSNLYELPEGVNVISLKRALRHVPEKIKAVIKNQFSKVADGVNALNLSLMGDGVVIQFEKGVELDFPLHVIHLNHSSEPKMSHSFNIIQMGDNARATIIESFHGVGKDDYFTNSQTVIQLGEAAELQYFTLQNEQRRVSHITRCEIEQAEKSHLTAYSLALGSQLSRHERKVQLLGEGAECYLNGLFIADDMQHHDFNLNVVHNAPGCISRESYRGIANHRGRGVFDGRVKVARHAQKSDAVMSSKNLLLSPHAEIDIKPQLEIYADDVKCSHGATVGQVDENALFYLRSRGIDESSARALLTFAFVNEVLYTITDKTIRRVLQREVLSHLPNSETLGRKQLWI